MGPLVVDGLGNWLPYVRACVNSPYGYEVVQLIEQ